MTGHSIPRLHLVTDRHRCVLPLTDAVVQAMAGGVEAVHLREPDLSARELWALAQALRDITAGRAALIINDRVDVALAVGADGVQLGQRSLPVSAARQLVAGRMIVGVSVHSLEEAVAAGESGADYVLLGNIYETTSHPGRPAAGLQLVKQVVKAVSCPVIAIGGITLDNATDVVQAGAWGVAAISALLESVNVKQAAQAFVASLAASGASRS